MRGGLLGEGQPLRGCEDIGTITPGIALRHPGLFTGRPYGTSVLGDCGNGGWGWVS